MATTTNYGWTTPDDTALVKDGAAAIRTLGSSIDSTLKTQIDAQIPDSLLTTKGDIIAATGASTPARLGVGTNGQALVANSTTATGLEWASPASGGMTLLSTTTLSGASTTISSINQTYTNLVILGTGITWASGNAAIYISPNSVDTCGNFTGTYNTSATSATTIYPFAESYNSSNSNSCFLITINNYADATHKPITFYGNNPNAASGKANMAGSITTTSAITSIKIGQLPDAVNLGGTIRIYGVK
jgi:hypothetical protein